MSENAKTVDSKSAYDRLMEGVRKKAPLSEIQKLYTAYVVAEMGGNKVQASAQLGIDRRTIQRWGIGPKNPPPH